MLKTIDLRDLHFAPLTSDTAAGATYGAMTKIAGLIKAKITPKGETLNQYSDGVLSDSVDYISSYEIELNLTDLDIPTQAVFLGHTITGGVMVTGALDQAPWLGIAFRAQKSNKKWRYVKMLKGKFSIPDDEMNTREDKLAGQTATIKGVFVCRIYDDNLKEVTDEDQSDYNPATGAAWFTAFGASDTTPPTLSSTTPTTNATGVAVGSTYQWAFSEAIQPGCVTNANFFLAKDADGAAVAGTLSLSGDKQTVTFTPTANLSAATAYRAICTVGVRDLAGNALAANQVRKFTTA